MLTFGRKLFRNAAAGLCGPLRLLARERTLLRMLVRRDIAGRTSGTLLGGLWMLAQPALQILAFWFLLDFVLQVRFPGRVPFVSYLLLGMVPWLMIAEVLNRAITVLPEFGPLYQRAVFPLRILPLVPPVVSGFIYGLVFFLTAAALEGAAAALWAPLIVLALFLWLTPFCYLLAVLGLFVRDAAQVFPFLMSLALYLTPILYLPEMLPEFLRPWLALNPFADIMALIHAALQGTAWSTGNLARPLALWLAALAPAWVLFRRSEPHMREAL
jgi:lipopolysaccharide transport system permease protein